MNSSDKSAAAKAMRALPEALRIELIEAGTPTVINSREKFLFRMKQVRLARSYRKGPPKLFNGLV